MNDSLSRMGAARFSALFGCFANDLTLFADDQIVTAVPSSIDIQPNAKDIDIAFESALFQPI